MGRDKADKITISIYIDRELVKLLDEIGKQQDRPRSWLIERAIRKAYVPEADRSLPHPPEEATIE